MDVIENFQALCWQCNANKGASDATDFRKLAESFDVRQAGLFRSATHRIALSSTRTHCVMQSATLTRSPRSTRWSYHGDTSQSSLIYTARNKMRCFAFSTR